jgi:hypothetical protein
MLIDIDTIMTAILLAWSVYCLWVTGNPRLKLMKIKLILERFPLKSND